MSDRPDCPMCDKYRIRQENYCRMCGKKLADAYARNREIYSKNERYCGYCGAKKGNCKH